MKTKLEMVIWCDDSNVQTRNTRVVSSNPSRVMAKTQLKLIFFQSIKHELEIFALPATSHQKIGV